MDAALARTEKLLRIADPDQWYKPSAAKAAAAKVCTLGVRMPADCVSACVCITTWCTL